LGRKFTGDAPPGYALTGDASRREFIRFAALSISRMRFRQSRPTERPPPAIALRAGVSYSFRKLPGGSRFVTAGLEPERRPVPEKRRRFRLAGKDGNDPLLGIGPGAFEGPGKIFSRST